MIFILAHSTGELLYLCSCGSTLVHSGKNSYHYFVKGPFFKLHGIHCEPEWAGPKLPPLEPL